MSARRWFQGALLLVALGVTAAVRPSHSPQIVARVGGNLAGRVGDTLNVPITVDLTGAPGVRLGGYRLTVRFDPNVLASEGGSPGTFAQPLVNEDSAGVLRMTAIQPSGADGIVTLGVGRFRVLSDTGSSDITIAFDEMSGVAPTFDDLLPILTVVNGTFCHASGKWGDVDGDGQANSRDALVALSQVVGIALDTLRVDTIMVPDSGARYDTLVTMRPGLADVDGDAQVTSRDALIIMSYAVGLPVPGFRIGLAAAGGGACGGSGLALSIAVAPDTLELQSGQTANAVVSARDAAGHPVSLSGATWTSNNTAVAGVTSPGFGIEARDPGVATLTARLGASYRASMVVKVLAHRTQWYADALLSQAAIQTGSQAFPFAFIGDALNVAYDGDSVHVAPGIYEERLSSDVAVTILGDTATDGSRPTIDARGYPGYDPLYPYNQALTFTAPAGRLELQNLRIVGGGAYVESRGLVVRNVRVEAPAVADAFYATRYEGSSLPPDAPFNVRIDRLDIAGYVNRGVYIDGADTAIVDSSTAVRDSLNGGTCSNAMALEQGGIVAQAVSYARIRGNTVINSPCSAIRVSQRSGRTEIGQNHVQGAFRGGIAADGDTVALDRNVVLNVGVGIWVRSDLSALRHVSSFADTVGTATGSAFRADLASVVDVDALYASNEYRGVVVTGGRLTLTHSQILDAAGSAGNGVGVCGAGSSLFSRGNRITNAGSLGIDASDCGGFPDTLVSVGDTLLTTNGSAIWSGASYTRVDSVRIDSTVAQYADGIVAVGGHILLVNAPSISRVAWMGIETHQVDTFRVTGGTITQAGNGGIWSGAVYTRVDSVRIDSTTGGQYADGISAHVGHVLLVNGSFVSRVGGTGIISDQVDTVRVTGGTIAQSGSHGVWVSNGLRLVADSVTVDGSGASSAYAVGVGAWHTRSLELLGSSVLRSLSIGVNVSTADSVLVSGNSIRENGSGTGGGIYLEYVTDSARIKGNAIENNGSGITAVYGSPLALDSNRVAGNTSAGWFGNDSSAGGSATRNLFLNNGWGVVVHPVSGGSTPPVLFLRRNSFSGNTFGAVAKNGSISTIDADSNYWGDPLGPNCRFTVGDPHCPVTPTAGDTILSPGVTFFPWLASADPEVAAVSALMLAQRQVRSARIPPSASPSTPPDMERLRARAIRPEERRDGGGNSAEDGVVRAHAPPTGSVSAARATTAQPRPLPPLMMWRKGQPPRPAKVHHPS